ncbi:hypothetical protein BHE74_00003177 [Ensete ventricosum]|nr:hypothetical protein BHE74_00003177 [Ensete ventricosum]
MTERSTVALAPALRRSRQAAGHDLGSRGCHTDVSCTTAVQMRKLDPTRNIHVRTAALRHPPPPEALPAAGVGFRALASSTIHRTLPKNHQSPTKPATALRTMDLSALYDMPKVFADKSTPVARVTPSSLEVEEVRVEATLRTAQAPSPKRLIEKSVLRQEDSTRTHKRVKVAVGKHKS